MESLSGLEASEQSVLFRGKVLSASDDLSAIGVSEGDTLNIIKGRRTRVNKPSEEEEGDASQMDSFQLPEGLLLPFFPHTFTRFFSSLSAATIFFI